jgi:hypothetical protein
MGDAGMHRMEEDRSRSTSQRHTSVLTRMTGEIFRLTSRHWALRATWMQREEIASLMEA